MSDVGVSVSGSLTVVFAANSQRKEAYIYNDSATQVVYLGLGSTLAAGYGVRLNPGQSWSTRSTTSINAITLVSGISGDSSIGRVVASTVTGSNSGYSTAPTVTNWAVESCYSMSPRTSSIDLTGASRVTLTNDSNATIWLRLGNDVMATAVTEYNSLAINRIQKAYLSGVYFSPIWTFATTSGQNAFSVNDTIMAFPTTYSGSSSGYVVGQVISTSGNPSPATTATTESNTWAVNRISKGFLTVGNAFYSPTITLSNATDTGLLSVGQRVQVQPTTYSGTSWGYMIATVLSLNSNTVVVSGTQIMGEDPLTGSPWIVYPYSGPVGNPVYSNSSSVANITVSGMELVGTDPVTGSPWNIYHYDVSYYERGIELAPYGGMVVLDGYTGPLSAVHIFPPSGTSGNAVTKNLCVMVE